MPANPRYDAQASRTKPNYGAKRMRIGKKKPVKKGGKKGC